MKTRSPAIQNHSVSPTFRSPLPCSLRWRKFFSTPSVFLNPAVFGGQFLQCLLSTREPKPKEYIFFQVILSLLYLMVFLRLTRPGPNPTKISYSLCLIIVSFREKAQSKEGLQTFFQAFLCPQPEGFLHRRVRSIQIFKVLPMIRLQAKNIVKNIQTQTISSRQEA